MSVLESLLGNVLEISLALAAVIAALLILRPLLMRRYRSRLYYQIWLLVAVRLIIPLNFSLPDPPVQVQAPAVTVYHVESARSAPAEPRYRALTEEDYLTEVQETASRTAEPVSRIQAQYTPVLNLPQLISLLWLAGAVSFFSWNLLAYLRFRRQIHRWREPETQPDILERFETCRQELCVRSLSLERCPAVSSPLVTGFFRPALLLPSVDLSPAELDAIFRHELIHIRRHDLWYKLLLLLARSLHWFNPMVHWMAGQAGRDLERSCDEAVVDGRDLSFRERYGRAILSAAERDCRLNAPLTSCFYGGRNIVMERLYTIVGQSGKKQGLILLAIAAVLISTLAAACSVRGASMDFGNSSAVAPAKTGSLPGYEGPTEWDLGDYSVELTWKQDSESPNGRLAFCLVQAENRDVFQYLPEDYGPDLAYPYPGSISVRPFSDVLGQDGFVLTYGLGMTSTPVEYYTTDENGAPQLLLACDGQVWEADLDNDGDAELLECRYGIEGEARIYDLLSGEDLNSEPGGSGQVAVADVNSALAQRLGFLQGGVGAEYLPPEAGYRAGEPLEFLCFARMNDVDTPAGNAVPENTTVSLAWEDLPGFQAPVSSFTSDDRPLWPEDPDGTNRDSGTLW